MGVLQEALLASGVDHEALVFSVSAGARTSVSLATKTAFTPFPPPPCCKGTEGSLNAQPQA